MSSDSGEEEVPSFYRIGSWMTTQLLHKMKSWLSVFVSSINGARSFPGNASFRGIWHRKRDCVTTGNNIKKKTVSNVSLHFVPSLQSAVCILYLVCILYPVCSLQSAVCILYWPYNKAIWFWFVKAACREKTCLAFALSRAQRQNVSLYNLYRNDGHKLCLFPSNRYNFLTISKSSVFSILFYLFNLQCLLFLVSPKVLNTYRNPSTGMGKTRFVLAQRMSV